VPIGSSRPARLDCKRAFTEIADAETRSRCERPQGFGRQGYRFGVLVSGRLVTSGPSAATGTAETIALRRCEGGCCQSGR
jgi:hypothetical protein